MKRSGASKDPVPGIPRGGFQRCRKSGKVRHSTRAGARMALWRTPRDDADSELRFYECVYCHGFHLTSSEAASLLDKDAALEVDESLLDLG